MTIRLAELRSAALAAAERGWRVFPLWPGTKIPRLHGAQACPHTGDCRQGHQRWEQRASSDPDRITRCWHDHAPPFNVGIATGPSGLVVIDLDAAAPDQHPPPPWDQPGITGGEDVFLVLCAEAGQVPPLDTYTVTTPSQPRPGMHLYYQAPVGVVLRNTAGPRRRGLGWKIDTRAAGGAVVAAGSLVRGRRYQLTSDVLPMPLPDWLAARLAQPTTPPSPPGSMDRMLATAGRRSRYALAALRGEVDRVLTAGQNGAGSRNDTLNTAAFAIGQLVRANLIPHQLAEDALLRAGTAVGLSEQESLATIHSGLSAGAQAPRRARP
jgi:hypothetical protein